MLDFGDLPFVKNELLSLNFISKKNPNLKKDQELFLRTIYEIFMNGDLPIFHYKTDKTEK